MIVSEEEEYSRPARENNFCESDILIETFLKNDAYAW